MMNNSSVAAVRFDGVSRYFGEIRAVDQVDLEIQDGEFFSMLGPSGSGKTTCLRMSRVLTVRPREGSIYTGRTFRDCRPMNET